MIGLYTALFGPYDRDLSTPYPGTLFTDQAVERGGWEVVRVDSPHPDPRYASRYYFDQSCKAMPDYEYTVMHGGNSQLKVSPADLVALLPDDIDIAVCKHPRRSVYKEAEACIRMGKDDAEVINYQMSRYRGQRFPVNFSLSACILMVRRNTPRLAEFEAFWWNEVKSGSCRDQLSFDYSRWKLDMPIFYLPKHWRNYITSVAHKRGKKDSRP